MTLETKKDTEPRWIWLAAGCLLILLAAVLMPSPKTGKHPIPPRQRRQRTQPGWRATTERLAAAYLRQGRFFTHGRGNCRRKIEQIQPQTARSVEALAKKYKITVLPDVERFFDALDAGNWEEAQRFVQELEGKVWIVPALICPNTGAPFWKRYGAAQQVQLWPPQQLLDYGNGILDSLKPGMVYFAEAPTRAVLFARCSTRRPRRAAHHADAKTPWQPLMRATLIIERDLWDSLNVPQGNRFHKRVRPIYR